MMWNIKKLFRTPSYKIQIIVFAFVVLVFSVLPVCNYFRSDTKDRTKDYGKLYRVGQIVLQEGDIYHKRKDSNFQFMYPPTAAVFLAITSMAGLLPFIVIFVLANSVAWAGSILLSIYLVTGKILRQHPLLYLVPAFCCAPYVWDIYMLGQPNLLLLVCMLGAFASLQSKKDWCAGALIALAAAIKAFPILSIAYLVYRKRWKALYSTFAFLFFLIVLLPVPFRGFHRNLKDIQTWSEGMVFRYDATSIAQRPDRGYSYKNQSLIAVANRLLRPVDAFQTKSKPVCVNFTDIDFKYINAIIICAGLGLCFFYITSMPRHNCCTAYTNAIEYAMLLLLILIFTPLSFTYFYVWLLYPVTVVMDILIKAPHRSRQKTAILCWFAVCLILLGFMLPIPTFDQLTSRGNTFWASTFLLFGLGWKLRQLRTLPYSKYGSAIEIARENCLP